MKRRVGRHRQPVAARRIYAKCHVTGKTRFPDELTAKIEAARMTASGNLVRSAYQCKHCQMFHLTDQRRRRDDG